MKYAFILAWTVAYPVTVMCCVLRVSTSGFYRWKALPVSKRKARNTELRAKVREAFEASRRTYGSPRVRAELQADGVIVSEKTVAKIMREEQLHSAGDGATKVLLVLVDCEPIPTDALQGQAVSRMIL